MSSCENPLQSTPATTRKYLAPLFDGHLIALFAVLSSLAILSSSLLAPNSVFVNAPRLSAMGQNTALAMLMLGCAILFSRHPAATRPANDDEAHQVLPIALATLSLLLAVMALLQSALNAYPADSWMRILVNTLPSDENNWPGRMSPTTALIVTAYSLTLICLGRPKSCHLTLKAALIGLSLLTAFASVTSHLLGIADYSPYAFMSLPTAAVLTLYGTVLLQRLSTRQQFLKWETQHPGEAIFVRVLVPLSLLLATTAVAICGNATEGHLPTAMLALAGLTLLVLVIIYRYIIGTVNNRLTAELQLAEREAALAQAQAQAMLGSWQLNIRDNTLSGSAEFLRILGLAADTSFSLKEFMVHVHPDDQDYVRKRWRQSLAGSGFDIEYRILVAGSTRWVRDQATFVADRNGDVLTVLGTIQDITQLKAKELQLLRSRERIRNLAARNERIREQERRRLARELHDEMGQHLTALRLDTAMALMRYSAADAELKTTLSGLKAGIDTLIKITRDTAASLRPPALDFGLAAAIEWLLQDIESRTGIRSRLTADLGTIELDDELRTAAFRIIQESLTNVTKHAHATEVRIHIYLQEQKLVLSITDNGTGFNPDNVREDKCFGLTGIQERIMMLGGEYVMNSQPGQGTWLSLSLPVRTLTKAHQQRDSTESGNYAQNIYS